MIKIKFYNTREKIYHDGKRQIVIYKDIYIEKGEKGYTGSRKRIIEQFKDNDIGFNEYLYKQNRSLIISQKRTINKVYDISRCNSWEWFITLTFNQKKLDRYNYDIVSKKLKSWLDRVRRTSKDLKYIIVPELHKDGAYHFHGLFSNCEFEFVDSGIKDRNGNKVYNIPSYKLGFTTATKVKNTNAANKYIAKYLNKDLFKATSGKKRYWASRNVNLPVVCKTFEHDIQGKIKSLENSRNLISKQVKQYTYVSDDGEEFKSEVIYFELDS